jgi:hypothetical protein
MDRRSLSKTERQIADYAHSVRKTGAFAVERNQRQPGDPAKLAAVDPPLRLPLGDDPLARPADKSAFVERETAKWRTLCESTGFSDSHAK